jgi:hypothetical protein
MLAGEPLIMILWQSSSSVEEEKLPAIGDEEYNPAKFAKQDIFELVVGRGNVNTSMACGFFMSSANGFCARLFNTESWKRKKVPLDD